MYRHTKRLHLLMRKQIRNCEYHDVDGCDVFLPLCSSVASFHIFFKQKVAFFLTFHNICSKLFCFIQIRLRKEIKKSYFSGSKLSCLQDGYLQGVVSDDPCYHSDLPDAVYSIPSLRILLLKYVLSTIANVCTHCQNIHTSRNIYNKTSWFNMLKFLHTKN